MTIRWQAYAVAALVLVATLFGGGGAEGPLNNGIIQGLAAILLSLLFASHVRGTWPLPKVAAGATWLLLSLLLIVLLQLVPLPPDLWRSLPGRELAEASLALVGASDEWRPLSLDPEATRRVGASLLLPAAILYGILGATRREVLLVVTSALVAAGISALIGALQLILSNPSWLSYYEGPPTGVASGVFANPNHHANFLIASILLLGFLIRAQQSTRPVPARGSALTHLHPAWLALPFLVIMVLATGSRTGIVLLLIAAPGALLVGIGRRSPLLWMGGLAAVALIAGLTIMFSPSGNVLAIGQSFILSGDTRYDFLPDVVYTLRQYWPLGSGLGTFIPVFAPNENLDVAGPAYVNRAHNDWLEWLIETGVVGAIWLVVAGGLLAWRLVKVALNRGNVRGTQFAATVTGALILLLLAFHSLIDYPVRIEAISAVAALAVGLMFSPLTDAPPRPVSDGGPRWALVLGGIAGVILAALVLRIFVAHAAVRNDTGATALSLRPQNSQALTLVAEQHFRTRNLAAARRLAVAAVERAPLNSSAVRVLAMTLQPAAAMEPWRIASAMGWRDGPTQLWAFQQALANGEFEVAATRADAFLRTRSRMPDQFLPLLRMAALDPQFRSALIKRMALEPSWRAKFFALPAKASAGETQGTYELLRALASTGKNASRAESSATIERLIKYKNYARAAELYRLVRGGAEGSEVLLSDGSFNRPAEEYRSNSTPFDWLLTPVRGGTATIEEREGRFLYLETGGTAPLVLLRRYVSLDPGTYRLEYLRRGDADSPQAIGIFVRCVDGDLLGSSPTEPLRGSGYERRGLTFTVDPKCPMIELRFEANAAGQPTSAEFDEFSIRREGRA